MLIKRSLIALLLTLVLFACGQKGPLRLKKNESQTNQAKSSQPQTDQASSKKTTETKESQDQPKQTLFD